MALDTNNAGVRIAAVTAATIRQLRGGLDAARTILDRIVVALAPAAGAVASVIGNSPPVRYLSGSLLRRILASNLIGLLILIIGVLYLSMSHGWLLDAKRESLQKQGQIIAAAIGENTRPENVPNISGIDLPEPPRVPYRDDNFAALELTLKPERVAQILDRMITPPTANKGAAQANQGPRVRARIYDRAGNLVVDTATLPRRGRNTSAARPEINPDDRPKTRNFWTRLGTWLIDNDLPVYREIGTANGRAYPEVRKALEGEPTAVLLLDDELEQIVAIAEPIRRGRNSRTVEGVLFLSTPPGEISGILSEERQVIWTLAAFALLATLTSSWLLARTVAEPMRELSAAAHHVSRSISARTELPDHANRRDEVGQMAAAFRTMTAALYRRIEASEKFAADVAHELKNPLAAARSTAESLSYARTPEQRDELIVQIQWELKRLNRLINDVANASRLDAELARQKLQPVDLGRLLTDLVRSFADIHSGNSRTVRTIIDPSLVGDGEAMVDGHDGRLGQVVTNLLDNALSFSPEGGTVTVALTRRPGLVVFTVSDEGPGIPGDKLEAVFERFYSDRPSTDQSHGKNSGLGLSISREIVVAHGGRIYAENVYAPRAAAGAGGTPIGARFTVELPASPTATGRTSPPGGRRAGPAVSQSA